MRRCPMPSPRGTNHAGLYLPPNFPASGMAYDAATGLADSEEKATIAKILAYLKGKLSDADLDKVAQLLSGEEARAEDEPPPFEGRPRPGGRIDALEDHAMDARLRGFGFDSAARTRILDLPRQQRSLLTTRLLEHRNRQAADFARRFPEIARIKKL